MPTPALLWVPWGMAGFRFWTPLCRGELLRERSAACAVVLNIKPCKSGIIEEVSLWLLNVCRYYKPATVAFVAAKVTARLHTHRRSVAEYTARGSTWFYSATAGGPR